MSYIYGPVQSRRLGYSLGVSLTPYKTCSFDCVYCQLGATTDKTRRRSAFVRPDEVIQELSGWLKGHPVEARRLDYISLAGLGEPTLNTGIAEVIRAVKTKTKTKVAVLTNSSLFIEPGVRKAVIEADLVVPSLDAVAQDIFEKIDRPAPGIKVKDIIEALVSFRKEFRNNLWLEVMIVKGMNDSLPHARKMRDVVKRIQPDRVQLNSPVRATAEPWVKAADKTRIEEIRKIIGAQCEII